MAAYAEGLNILKHANVGKTARESTPRPARCAIRSITKYDFNLADVAEVWRRGSVVASWLLDLTAIALLDQNRISRNSPAAFPIPAKGAGLSTRLSTNRLPFRS